MLPRMRPLPLMLRGLNVNLNLKALAATQSSFNQDTIAAMSSPLQIFSPFLLGCGDCSRLFDANHRMSLRIAAFIAVSSLRADNSCNKFINIVIVRAILSGTFATSSLLQSSRDGT